MRLIEGEAERGPIVSLGVVVGAVGALALTVLTRFPPERTVPVLALAIVLVMWQRRLLAWRSLVAGILLVIFFIPIRYTIPGNLPFQLEPYRLLVALVLAGWLSALLVDPRVRLRKSGLEGPLLVFVAAAVASDLANWSRVTSLGVETNVTKSLTFLLSFVLVVYLVVSVVRSVGRPRLRAARPRRLRRGAGGMRDLRVCERLQRLRPPERRVLVPAQRALAATPCRAPSRTAAEGVCGCTPRRRAPSPSAPLFVIRDPLAVYLACTQRRKLAWWTATAVLGSARSRPSPARVCSCWRSSAQCSSGCARRTPGSCGRCSCRPCWRCTSRFRARSERSRRRSCHRAESSRSRSPEPAPTAAAAWPTSGRV